MAMRFGNTNIVVEKSYETREITFPWVIDLPKLFWTDTKFAILLLVWNIVELIDNHKLNKILNKILFSFFKNSDKALYKITNIC